MRIIRFVLLFLVCLLPISVEAHTSLKSSNPAEGSALSEPVDRIRLTFSEAVEKTIHRLAVRHWGRKQPAPTRSRGVGVPRRQCRRTWSPPPR